MNLVITMSRRFGTGASAIAAELSERLDIPVYDKAYILLQTYRKGLGGREQLPHDPGHLPVRHRELRKYPDKIFRAD